MTRHNSTALLSDYHRRTEAILQKAIAGWQMLPPEHLAQQPGPSQWSAAQCMEHLNHYGLHYLPAIEHAIASARQRGKAPVAVFQSGWLGAYFTQLMLPQADGRLKSKMKSPKDAVPSIAPDPQSTLAEFMEQQERMLQLLDAARLVNIQAVRVPISLSRWVRLRLGDTFGFVVAHNERHVAQAERALERVKNTQMAAL